jgi:hypothetical protein
MRWYAGVSAPWQAADASKAAPDQGQARVCFLLHASIRGLNIGSDAETGCKQRTEPAPYLLQPPATCTSGLEPADMQQLINGRMTADCAIRLTQCLANGQHNHITRRADLWRFMSVAGRQLACLRALHASRPVYAL